MPRQNFSRPALMALLLGSVLGGCVAQQPDPYYYGPYGPRYARPLPRYEVVEVERVYRPRRPVIYAEPVERVRPAPRPRYAPVEARRAPVYRRAEPPVKIGPDPAREGGQNGGGGGGAGGGGGGGGGWSDIRLKRNIQPLGTAANGLPLYAFDYIWGGDRMVGVMAQDVLKMHPDAVITTASGYMKVDYSRLGLQIQTYAEWLAP